MEIFAKTPRADRRRNIADAKASLNLPPVRAAKGAAGRRRPQG